MDFDNCVVLKLKIAAEQESLKMTCPEAKLIIRQFDMIIRTDFDIEIPAWHSVPKS